MKVILKNTGLTLLTIGLLVGALYGRSVPMNKSIYKKIGRFSLRPYKYGLYLTQIPSGIFYNFTPHNDYYIDTNGIETRLVAPGSDIVNKESTYIYKTNKLTAKILATSSYLDLSQLRTTFDTKEGPVTYESQVSGNTLSIKITQLPPKLTLKKLIMTMSVNSTDKITESNDYILIENPKTLGVIKIEKGLFPYPKVTFDKEKSLIEFEVSNTDPKIEMQLFDSLEKII